MAEYSSLKVPELKKLLAEKNLAQTGNKADLIARLQEHDKESAPAADKPGKHHARASSPGDRAASDASAAAESKEDEINYSDDDTPAAPAEKPAAEAAPATEPTVASAEATTDKPAEGETAVPAEEEAAKEPAPSYAIGLASTAADAEAKKRADRAKRFGIEEEDDAKKRADRASRFGIDEKELASGLDAALPERPLKRGRGRGTEIEGARPEKRQSLDRRGGGRRGGRGGRGGRGDGEKREGGAQRGGILNDPSEKAKAEKRAARFAAA